MSYSRQKSSKSHELEEETKVPIPMITFASPSTQQQQPQQQLPQQPQGNPSVTTEKISFSNAPNYFAPSQLPLPLQRPQPQLPPQHHASATPTQKPQSSMFGNEPRLSRLPQTKQSIENAEVVKPQQGPKKVQREALRATSSRFTVLRQQELGSGGFGVVYRGFDNERGEHVAVKETVIGKGNEPLVAALESEFATLVSLSHPHIVRVYLFAVESGVAQIFMEWMSSGSVSGILHQIGRRLHENVVRRYAKEALEGLAYLHGKGILHRDIKPANMLVDGNGALKLSDFGTCRAALAGTVTTTQHVVGTSAYMAPEAISRGKYSVASDIWALGCTIIETATGRMPWSHLPAEQLQPIPLMFHIGTARPPDHHPPIPEHLSAELRQLLEEIFRLDPADRPTAAALLASPYFQRDELPKDAETLDAYEVATVADVTRYQDANTSSNAVSTSSLVLSTVGSTTISQQ